MLMVLTYDVCTQILCVHNFERISANSKLGIALATKNTQLCWIQDWAYARQYLPRYALEFGSYTKRNWK